MTNGGKRRAAANDCKSCSPGDELVVLDDFRFKKRMPSRAAAIRELLKRGLAAEGFQAAAFGTKSEDFGVLGKAPGRPRKIAKAPHSFLPGRQGTVGGRY